MKKAILFIFSALTIGSINTNAQTFTVDKDTVKATIYNGYAEVHDKVINATTAAINLKWKVTYQNLPSAWTLNGFGICDNSTCINFFTQAFIDNSTFDALPVSVSDFMDLKLQIDVTKWPNGGPYYITANVTDKDNPSNTKNVTFEITNKFATNVANVNRPTDIVMYPNPARNELNVLFDGNAGIKNITVYNLIGKAVTVYKVNGNSANLDVSNIPSGIYFIRLVDARGIVVATRKFTHQ